MGRGYSAALLHADAAEEPELHQRVVGPSRRGVDAVDELGARAHRLVDRQVLPLDHAAQSPQTGRGATELAHGRLARSIRRRWTTQRLERVDLAVEQFERGFDLRRGRLAAYARLRGAAE